MLRRKCILLFGKRRILLEYHDAFEADTASCCALCKCAGQGELFGAELQQLICIGRNFEAATESDPRRK